MQTKSSFNEMGRAPRGAFRGGYSQVDLVVTIGVVAILAVWLGVSHWGERGRTARCAGNLQVLGHAMHDFAGDHENGLPAAGMDLPGSSISWDTLVVQYLKLRSVDLMAQFVTCPSDPAPHNGSTRSYAMGGNDMAPEHWPPGGDSATGVGLFWDNGTVLSLANREALQKLELLPALKLSAVPVPAETLLLTDFIDPNNTMGNPRQTTVFNTSQQRHYFDDAGARFHRSRFNYLMVDGHVEWLSPLQTAAVGGATGIWNLKKTN